MRVLVFGDSISQGCWDTQGGWVARLKKEHDTKNLEEIFSRDFTTVFNLGISGNTSRDILNRFEAETRARAWLSEKLTLVFSVGINDSKLDNGKSRITLDEFTSNVGSIVKRAKKLSDRLLLVGLSACEEDKTTPVFWDERVFITNDRIAENEKALHQIAQKQGIAFVPNFEEFKKRLDVGESLLADGLHPNDAGHELILQLVRPELDKLLAA